MKYIYKIRSPILIFYAHDIRSYQNLNWLQFYICFLSQTPHPARKNLGRPKCVKRPEVPDSIYWLQKLKLIQNTNKHRPRTHLYRSRIYCCHKKKLGEFSQNTNIWVGVGEWVWLGRQGCRQKCVFVDFFTHTHMHTQIQTDSSNKSHHIRSSYRVQHDGNQRRRIKYRDSHKVHIPSRFSACGCCVTLTTIKGIKKHK